MGVNSLPTTVTRRRRGCDLKTGPTAPESSTLTTRLPSHPGRLINQVEIDVSDIAYRNCSVVAGSSCIASGSVSGSLSMTEDAADAAGRPS